MNDGAHEIFLYTETVDCGKLRDETRWYGRNCEGLSQAVAEIAATMESGELALRTLCVGFAEDYERMTPLRVGQGQMPALNEEEFAELTEAEKTAYRRKVVGIGPGDFGGNAPGPDPQAKALEVAVALVRCVGSTTRQPQREMLAIVSNGLLDGEARIDSALRCAETADLLSAEFEDMPQIEGAGIFYWLAQARAFFVEQTEAAERMEG